MKVGIIGLGYVGLPLAVAFASLAGRLHPTSAYADLGSCHAVISCVPTPLTSPRGPDLVRL